MAPGEKAIASPREEESPTQSHPIDSSKSTGQSCSLSLVETPAMISPLNRSRPEELRGSTSFDGRHALLRAISPHVE